MHILIFANQNKESSKKWVENLSAVLMRNNTTFERITLEDIEKEYKADAIFILGGDGTILSLVDFANRNSLPILSFNAGKLGFLTEFEQDELEEAVMLLQSNKLKKDYRLTFYTEYNGKRYSAMNDIVIQRLYTEDGNGLVTELSLSIDDEFVDKILGDGIIFSTPTGSTAYSLSAGGSILAPGINAYIMTPLSAHSLHHRPIVYSSCSTCNVELIGGSKSGVFIDGKYAFTLNEKDKITITGSNVKTLFLRRKNYNFFKRLSDKLSKNMER